MKLFFSNTRRREKGRFSVRTLFSSFFFYFTTINIFSQPPSSAIAFNPKINVASIIKAKLSTADDAFLSPPPPFNPVFSRRISTLFSPLEQLLNFQFLALLHNSLDDDDNDAGLTNKVNLKFLPRKILPKTSVELTPSSISSFTCAKGREKGSSFWGRFFGPSQYESRPFF